MSPRTLQWTRTGTSSSRAAASRPYSWRASSKREYASAHAAISAVCASERASTTPRRTSAAKKRHSCAPRQPTRAQRKAAAHGLHGALDAVVRDEPGVLVRARGVDPAHGVVHERAEHVRARRASAVDDLIRRARAALDKVGLLNKERRHPLGLSGGEQQRVGIARAIVHKPPVILADEPTGNLDPELSAEIMNLFREFNQVGVTVLIASHDLALISRMGVRMLRLQQGRLVQEA